MTRAFGKSLESNANISFDASSAVTSHSESAAGGAGSVEARFTTTVGSPRAKARMSATEAAIAPAGHTRGRSGASWSSSSPSRRRAQPITWKRARDRSASTCQYAAAATTGPDSEPATGASSSIWRP